MARRRFKRAGLNTKLIMDVGLAGLATRVLPIVVNKFVPVDPTISALVGAGGTYVVGSMLKKPDMANAGVALGVVEFVAPIVEDLIGGMVAPSAPMQPITKGVSLPVPIVKTAANKVELADFISLNDGSYMPYPVPQSSREYAHGY